MCRTHSDGGEPRAQRFFAALAPTDLPPGRRWQAEGQLLYRNGLMVCTTLQALRWCTPTCFSRRRRRGLLSWFPDCGVRLNAHYIFQTELGEVRTELRALPITRICQYHSRRNLLFHRLPNLLQRNLRLGLERHPFGNARLSAPCDILAPHLRQV